MKLTAKMIKAAVVFLTLGLLFSVVIFAAVITSIIGAESSHRHQKLEGGAVDELVPINITGTYDGKNASLKVSGDGISISGIKGTGDSKSFRAKNKGGEGGTVSLPLPTSSAAKLKNGMSYMARMVQSNYTMRLWTGYPGYKLANNMIPGKKMTKDSDGLARVGNDYVIALGSAYVPAGDSSVGRQRYRVTIRNGNKDKSFTALLGDTKKDNETDKKHMFHLQDGSVVEMHVWSYKEKFKNPNTVFPGTLVKLERIGASIARLRGELGKKGKSVNTARVIEGAKKYIGVPYKKIDCGALIEKAYKYAGINTGKFRTNRLVDGSFGTTVKVAKSKKGPMFTYKDVKDILLPGDILVSGMGDIWNGARTGKVHYYSHVMLYAGGGEIIHSTSTKKNNGVKKAKLGSRKLYRIVRVTGGSKNSKNGIIITGDIDGSEVYAEGTYLNGKINASGWWGNGASGGAGGGNGTEDMVRWATKIAKGANKHGYSQANRTCSLCRKGATPDYDCSSFVTAALAHNNMGKDFMRACKNTWPYVTSNLGAALSKNGWKNVGNLSAEKCRRGDIVLNPARHVEICCGGGVFVGAHNNYDGKSGETRDNEISVKKAWGHWWTQVWRYQGGKKK